MLDALYEKETAATLDDRQRHPQSPRKPEPSWWSGLPSAGPTGAAFGINETARAIARAWYGFHDEINRREQMTATPEIAANLASRRANMAEDKAAIDAALRSGMDYWRQDPATTSAAAQAVFGAARFIGKAGLYGLATGNPVAAAVATGADIGASEYLDLTDKGVDPETAQKVALVRGVSAGAAVALPAAGATKLATAGLAALGGPSAYVAEQAAAKAILQEADYSQLSDQIDPFDPLGLAVATLGAAGVGGAAYWLRARKAAQVGKVLQEEVDAARVVLAREMADNQSLARPGDLASLSRDAKAMDAAEMQIARGEPVNVADVAPVEVPPKLAEFESEINARLSEVVKAEQTPPRAEPATNEVELRGAKEGDAPAIAARVPDMEVEVEIDGVPRRMKVSEAVEAVRAAAQLEIDESRLLRVAAECALGVG